MNTHSIPQTTVSIRACPGHSNQLKPGTAGSDFTAGGGITSFSPEQIRDNTYKPPLFITSLKQGGDTINTGRAFELVKEISLTWDRNFFEFEAAALTYGGASKNHYQYILEGFDKQWYMAGSVRKGRYSGLPGGTYSFRIRGANNNGIFSDKEVLLKIRVERPFWKTWWFYTSIGILILLLAGQAYYSLSKQLQSEKALVQTQREDEKKLIQLINEKKTLIKELYHRTKNNMQVIQSILKMEALQYNNDSVNHVVHKVNSKIHTMSLVHQMLYESDNLTHINLEEYISKLTERLKETGGRSVQDLSVTLQSDQIEVVFDIAMLCGLIINELISNSLKYAFTGKTGKTDKKEEKIAIFISKTGEKGIQIRYSDNGVGVGDDFDITTLTTLGLKTVVRIVENQLGGSIHFENKNGLICSINFDSDRYVSRV